MVLNPIQSTSPPAIADVAPARAENTRPRVAMPSTVAARSPAPVLVPAPAPAPDDVRLQWDKDAGVVLKFTDKKSGEVVRQIPSDQVLSVVRFIRQLLEEDQTANTANNRSR